MIDAEKPDRVCIELDQRRYEALSQEQSFEGLDVKEVIRRKQLSTLLLNLILISYQKQLGVQLGVLPGAELLEAARIAERNGIPVELCDRDVRITLRRAWNAMSLWNKLQLVPALVVSLFDRPELSEDDLRELRQKDVASQLIDEIGAEFPVLKTVLIDERDTYLAQRIRDSAGERIVAVVGAGHLSGIRRALERERDAELGALEEIPVGPKVWKWIGWGIPAIVLGSIAFIGWQKGAEAAGDNALFWVLANGIPSMLGAVIALAHPGTVVTAFVAAPITSLTPVIGAGYVAAFAQTYFTPPLVRELHSVSEDLTSLRRWWTNRFLRIFLVFLLTTLGSIIGTAVGGAEIVSNLF